MKAYTFRVAFADAADAVQYAGLKFENGFKVRREKNCVTIYEVVLPCPEVAPLDDEEAITCDQWFKQDVETDIRRLFEDGVRNGIRASLPRPAWEIVDRRPLTVTERAYLDDQEEWNLWCASIDWEAVLKDLEEQFKNGRAAEDRL